MSGASEARERLVERLRAFHRRVVDRLPLTAFADVLEEAPRWRHKKRGTTYVEIGRGRFQMAGFKDDQPIVLYRSEIDASLWARPVSEFEDGRFEAVASAAPSPHGGS